MITNLFSLHFTFLACYISMELAGVHISLESFPGLFFLISVLCEILLSRKHEVNNFFSLQLVILGNELVSIGILCLTFETDYSLQLH